MQPLSKKRIFIGFLVDVGATWIFIIVGSFIIGFFVAANGIEKGDLELIFSSKEIQFLFFIPSCLATVLGGFVASTQAGYRHVAHGGWVGGIGLLLGAVFTIRMILSPSSQEIDMITEQWLALIGFIVTVPLGMLGGYIGQMVQDKKQAQTEVSQ